MKLLKMIREQTKPILQSTYWIYAKLIINSFLRFSEIELVQL